MLMKDFVVRVIKSVKFFPFYTNKSNVFLNAEALLLSIQTSKCWNKNIANDEKHYIKLDAK